MTRGPWDEPPEEEGPEGTGRVPDPEDAAQENVLRHVLDAVRGGDTPDIVPAASSVAGFAEFLAVEAVLDKRWPETKIAPTWSGSPTSSSSSATRSAATRSCT